MNVQIDPLINQNEVWAGKIRQANEVLRVELGKYVDQAAGHWSLEQGENGHPQFELELTDSVGSARRRFSDTDFEDADSLGWRLHHLWTEVLQDALHKHVKRMERFYQDEVTANHA